MNWERMGLLYESMAYLKSSKKLFGSIRITSTYFSLPTWNENGVVYSAWFLTSYHANANNYQQALDDVLWMNITVKFLEEALMSPSNETRFSFSLECIQNFNFPIHFLPFSPVSTWPRKPSRQSGHHRAKHVLWLPEVRWPQSFIKKFHNKIYS